MENTETDPGLLNFQDCWRENANTRKNLIPIFHSKISKARHTFLQSVHRVINELDGETRNFDVTKFRDKEMGIKKKGKLMCKYYKEKLCGLKSEEQSRKIHLKEVKKRRREEQKRIKERAKKRREEKANQNSGNSEQNIHT